MIKYLLLILFVSCATVDTPPKRSAEAVMDSLLKDASEQRTREQRRVRDSIEYRHKNLPEHLCLLKT